MYSIDIASLIPLLGLSAIPADTSRHIDPHMKLVEQGLTKASLAALKQATQLGWTQLVEALHVTARTLQRYRPEQPLPPPSERVLRIADVFAKGFEVFGDREMFRKWMRQPVPALGNTVPLTLLPSLYGMDRLIQELGRMEHGIFS